MTLLKSVLRCLALLSGLVVFLAFPSYYFCWFAFHSPAPGEQRNLAFLPEQDQAAIQEVQPEQKARGPGEPEPGDDTRFARVVLATAFNAVASQTDDTPEICAWGDRVRSGIIAVSRDLEKLGLTRGRKVHVEGFGILVVMDRLHDRKSNQIDIFMDSHRKAVRFGVQELRIRWETNPRHPLSGEERET